MGRSRGLESHGTISRTVPQPTECGAPQITQGRSSLSLQGTPPRRSRSSDVVLERIRLTDSVGIPGNRTFSVRRIRSNDGGFVTRSPSAAPAGVPLRPRAIASINSKSFVVPTAAAQNTNAKAMTTIPLISTAIHSLDRGGESTHSGEAARITISDRFPRAAFLVPKFRDGDLSGVIPELA